MNRTRRPGALRTASLRGRVTAFSLLVLAVALLLVGVLTDVVFAAQSRSDLRARLTDRATLAGQLVEQGVTDRDLARQLETDDVRAFVTDSDGTVYSARSVGGRGPGRRGAAQGDEVVREPLPDGSQLTLIGDAGQVTAAQRRLRRILFLLGAGALAVAGLVMLATTPVALAPLDAMTALARSITRGDRGRRLAPTRTDTELGRTAAAFDDMLDELEGAERTARSAEAVARSSEARTRRFVADAAHELRTPLAGVQAAAEAAVAPGLTAEERDRLHLLLLRETGRAGRLVDDLLSLARLDAGMELRREPVDLLVLARTEAERVRLLAPGLTIAVDGEPVTVPGDPQRLSQVLGNLLDNARRHTPPGGRITVTVAGPGVVRVADTGPGVPAADRDRIFDRLVRLDEARPADDGAVGLGLAIARGIARAHGGELRCVEPVDGSGATFELVLPGRDEAPTVPTRTPGTADSRSRE
ncbi:HAMP domain-containing sensor histidine kinase [Pseudonocardia sp. H11422]|uniref:sensor histidine kinase n=1 Tax=Pseudonocardia sp. H11422 TaxID=2835866 RepID=UPI0027E28A0A|nr:HAMP domain-containing sensor histidine kinase [Pseudonocardia sp. H11422]